MQDVKERGLNWHHVTAILWITMLLSMIYLISVFKKSLHAFFGCVHIHVIVLMHQTNVCASACIKHTHVHMHAHTFTHIGLHVHAYL